MTGKLGREKQMQHVGACSPRCQINQFSNLESDKNHERMLSSQSHQALRCCARTYKSARVIGSVLGYGMIHALDVAFSSMEKMSLRNLKVGVSFIFLSFCWLTRCYDERQSCRATEEATTKALRHQFHRSCFWSIKRTLLVSSEPIKKGAINT